MRKIVWIFCGTIMYVPTYHKISYESEAECSRTTKSLKGKHLVHRRQPHSLNSLDCHYLHCTYLHWKVIIIVHILSILTTYYFYFILFVLSGFGITEAFSPIVIATCL